MGNSRRIRIIKLFAVIAASSAQCISMGEVTSYYPLMTEPSWEETLVSTFFSDGSRVESERRNLLGVDSQGRFVLPIIEGFSGGMPIEDLTHSDGGEFGDPFDSTTNTDQSVTETGFIQWKVRTSSYNAGGGLGPNATVSVNTSTFTTLGLNDDDLIADGVILVRRIATIDEVVSNRYLQVLETMAVNENLGISFRSELRNVVEYRTVYAGTEEIPGLYPGTSPLVVTRPFEALVRVTEMVSTGTFETFLIEDGIETLYESEEMGTTSVTSIEWTVKGIGVVRQLLMFGDWLDPILDNSIFNNGSNIVGTTSLEELIPDYELISEQLLASGGSESEAGDTILTGLNQEIILWPIPEEREIIQYPADAAVQLAELAEAAGLAGSDLLPEAVPHGDGVPNILKFAFNMNLSSADCHTLSNSGNSGLPNIVISRDGQDQTLHLEFIRRKRSGLTYVPVYSTTLAPQDYIVLDGPESVTPFDERFERVSIEIPIDFLDSSSYFGRVKIQY